MAHSGAGEQADRGGQVAEHDESFRWTPANVVTVIRICCIPVFVAMMLLSWGSATVDEAVRPWVCAVVYALISLTDSLDGHLARSRNEVTTFGKFMDPIADKLLVTAALLVLCEQGRLTSVVPLVIVTREFLVSGLRMVAASEGVVIAASYIGKAKTATTLVAICLFVVKDSAQLAGVAWFSALSWATMLVAVALTIWSMADYFAKSWGLLMGGRGASSAAGKAGAAELPAASDGKAPDAPTGPDVEAGLAASAVPDAESLRRSCEERAAQVVRAAREAHVTLGTAESLTGGMVCEALTSVPGSSEVVAGGVASYMARVKRDVLDVPARVIEAQGVVSSATAARMAQGAARRLGVDVAVSVTGVAGPGGGTEETPVGTVWFGLSVADGQPQTETLRFSGNREQVRLQTTMHALELLGEGVAGASATRG